MVKIGILVGSLREGSFSGRVAKGIESLLPIHSDVTYIKIDRLPLYNQDYDKNNPQEYIDFRSEVGKQDIFIFVTPEHNRSVPAALKNAIDIASRPHGENKWAGKPALIASQSPGTISGFGANHHLRQMLTFVDVYAVQQPEVYIADTPSLFSEKGEILNEDTKDFLQAAVDKLFEIYERLS